MVITGHFFQILLFVKYRIIVLLFKIFGIIAGFASNIVFVKLKDIFFCNNAKYLIIFLSNCFSVCTSLGKPQKKFFFSVARPVRP